MSRMRTFIQSPQSIQAEPKFEKITLVDMLAIIASGGVAYLTKFLVLPIFSYLYVFLVPITCYILLLPSKHSRPKKNYQVMMTVLFRDRGVYRSINPLDKSESEEE